MSITLTRQELYDRVWTEPVDTLAKQFGISNVGLGKACRRHNIPVPPRGYWARKAAGLKCGNRHCRLRKMAMTRSLFSVRHAQRRRLATKNRQPFIR
jgi:hypothetical protein